MSRFDEQLDRMKALYTYGLNENSNKSNSAIEYHAVGADGKDYAIIRECSRFYIKSCPKGQENLVEAYDYLGGICNKRNYEYSSYNKAIKNFELKMASINEAYGKKTQEVKKEHLVEDAQASQMSGEISRIRQIMESVESGSLYKYASKSIGSTPFKNQPEAEHGHSGDKDAPFTSSVGSVDMQATPKSGNDPKKAGAPFGETEKTKEGEDISVEGAVASAHPSGGKCVKINEQYYELDDEDEVDFEGDESLELDSEDINDENVDVDIDSEDSEIEAEDDLDDFDLSDDDLSDEEESEGDDEEDIDLDLDSDEDSEEEIDLDDEDNSEEGEELEDDSEEVESDFESDEPSDDESEEEDEIELVDDESEEGEGEDDHKDEFDMISESRKAELKPIINSLVSKIMKEEKLNAFGQHSGYRKKPMTLPKAEGDVPFGQSIGDSDPFTINADALAESILAKLAGKKKI